MSVEEEKFLSPGEKAAMRLLLTERRISRSHQSGLLDIQRLGLQRPTQINIGCGNHKKDGFLNIDLFPPADITLDLRLGLPFESSCCELIISEHCFEHFDYPEPISHMFREYYRVLKNNGVLSFSVPDTAWPLYDYRDGADASYFQACKDNAWWHPSYCTTRLEYINNHFRRGGEHLFAYDFETAEKLLKACGFVNVRKRDYDPQIDSAHRELGSLFIYAQKLT